MKLRLLCVLMGLSSMSVAGTAKIDSFTPEGTVKNVKQVVARFSEPVVSFGDPRAAAPFEIECSEKGSGRWLDPRQWVFDFEKDLPAGVLCKFVLKKGAKTLKGNEIAGKREFRFSTGGPAITRSMPYEGNSGIDEDQVFVLRLDSPVNESSVKERVGFVVEGIQERVGVRFITGGDADKILKRVYFAKKEERDRIVLLQAKQVFPNARKVELVWGKGVLSKSGVPTDQDQVLPFVVRTPFTAEFSCERENKDAACLPIGRMSLNLSAAIPGDVAAKIVLKDSAGKVYPVKEKEESSTSWVTFAGPFPEKTEFTITLPRGLKDDADRPLVNAGKYPLKVKTDGFPPLAKFSAGFGVVEAKGTPLLPVTIRNLEPDLEAKLLKMGSGTGLLDRAKNWFQNVTGKKAKVATQKLSEILFWLKRVERAQREHSVFSQYANETSVPVTGKTTGFKIPRKEKPSAFEVVGIPVEGPGFYVVELESKKLGASLIGADSSFYVPTAVLVTNMGVHFKWGRESSLVWVTVLDSGKPVPGAVLEIRDCTGHVLWKGQSSAEGVARVDQNLKRDEIKSCSGEGDYSQLNYGVLVTAQKDQDLAFVHSSWDNGIETWRFQVPTGSWNEGAIAHTVFDRSLLRAGETIHMRHFLRRHTRSGITGLGEKALPTTLVIEHSGTNQKYKMPIKWDAGQSAETEWKIPREAKLGSYSLSFTTEPKKKGEKEGPQYSSGSFSVEEFRVPLMKAVVQGPAEPLVAPSKAEVDLAVTYLSGGGAGGAAVKLSSQIQPIGSWSFPEHDDFVFANGVVEVGRTRTNDDEEESSRESADSNVTKQSLTLDKNGTLRATISKLPKKDVPYRILGELQFQDPNGETQTVASWIPVFPAKALVGVKYDSWATSKEKLKLTFAVVDVKGKPLASSPVRVELLERKSFSHRKRLLGGFYSYESYRETKKLGNFCEGVTDGKGLFHCEGKSPISGNVIVQAHSRDSSGNATSANREIWVAGENEWWFGAQDNDRIDVLPEKKRYEPGQTAKFQVRMPFREATALVSVEREGVMDLYVRQLSGKAPFVEIPVKENYAPNVFVSVMAVRGRVGDAQPTALVDLGRPAYKLGIGEISVGWRKHELKVRVTPERTSYRVREKAKVKVSVRLPDGKAPVGGDVIIAAVDEGLLELKPNESWKLLEAMMGRRSYEIQTSTAQMHVVGRRHFGLKALPSGGGGGADQATRELFETLLLWKGKVPLKNGEAVVEVPLNDSITSFRIVAIAVSGVDRFGTGHGSVRTTQDLMLFSGIPPLAREGDKLRAGFTLRNTTSRKMDVSLGLKVSTLPELPALKVPLAPGEAKEVGWEISVPNEVTSLTYEVSASEPGGTRDRMKIVQKVVPAVAVRTFQATLLQVDKQSRLPVERPKDAIVGRGGVEVHLKPSLLNGLEGIRDYMKEYPYSCLEQQVSRAIALRDKKLWQTTMEKLPSYLDGSGLAKYFPLMDHGSDVLTAYVLSIASEAGWKIPASALDRMTSALTRFVEGSLVVYSALPTADLAVRKVAAIEAVSRYGDKDVKPKWLTSFTIEPNLWPTSAVLDWTQVLGRGEKIPRRDERLAEAQQILRSRINYQGTTLNFSTADADDMWWLMASTDVNAVRAVSAFAAENGWREEMPRLMKGAIARQHRGHWDLTVANAWGVLALEKFATNFEKTPVAGATQLALAPGAENFAWKSAPKGKRVLFAWPGKLDSLVVTHDGTGKPWALVQSLAAIPLKEPLAAGYRVEKQIRPIEQKTSGKWSRGDIARIRLVVKADADMTWVVVQDPIPTGAAVLGGGLGRDSAMATQGEKREGWVWPAFEERSFEAFRAYYECVPKGEFVTEYTIRLNNGGTFALPPTRVEAMYSPEMFSELPNPNWEIQQ